MKKFSFIFFMGLSMLVPVFVFAQTSSIRTDAFNQLNSAGRGSGAGYSEYRNPQETVARIIKVALTVLGTIFLLLALYAGFLWMTAAGNDEQVGKATSILKAAVIGLAVILVAYSLTIFVFNSLIRSTTQMNIDNENSEFCMQNPADPRCAL